MLYTEIEIVKKNTVRALVVFIKTSSLFQNE